MKTNFTYKLNPNVRLNTAYFAENNKKIIKKLQFMCGLQFIILNALFMSHEQCKRHLKKKKKKKKKRQTQEKSFLSKRIPRFQILK